MDTFLMLTAILLLAVFAVSGVLFVVKKLRKKPTKTGVISLASLSVSVVSFVLFIGVEDSWSDMFLLLAILAFLSLLVLLAAVLVRRIRKKKRLVHWICIALVIALMIGSYQMSNRAWSREVLKPENAEITVKTDYDFVVEDGDTPLTVLTDSGWTKISRFHSVYDSSAFALVLEKTGATEQDCIDAINQNPNIGKKFKKYFVDFTHRLAEQYPQADLSILYHNLSTLRITELDKRDYLLKSLSADSYGCYRMDENAIYIPRGTVYKEGEWGFQVLIHEFCHAARNAWWTDADSNIRNRVQFRTVTSESVDRSILEESMNSAFSCSLLHYYEKDIAYQLPSNYLRIMLECMDNYTLDDYINHSDLYFLHKLDEYIGYTNYADVIWRLITLQRYDGQSDRIDIPAEAYDPIYDYICKMYYDKNITSDMDDAQRKAVADELADKAFFDVSEQYKINPDYFYTYLDSYVPVS